MLSLICEGRCYPNLPALDAAVEDVRARTKHFDQHPGFDSWLIASLREQQHTPHQRLGAKCVCQQCGQVRQY